MKNRLLFYLKEIDVFSDIPESEMKKFLNEIKDIVLKKGEYAILGNTLFILKKGFVKIESISPEGKVSVLKIFGPGDVFGTLSEKQENTNLWIVPLTDSLICTVESFWDILKKCPNISVRIIKQLTKYVSELENKLHNVMVENAEKKVISTLLELYEKFVKENGLDSIPVSHEDIANMTGLARETVTRILLNLKDGGAIDYTKGAVKIKDLKKLESQIQTDF